MSDIQLPSGQMNYVLNNSNLKIGILMESLSGSYQEGVWNGIQELAKKYSINLICFTGGALDISPDDPWEKERNVMYDIAEVADLDGILVSGTLCSYVTDEVIQKFLKRFSHLPVVSLLPLSKEIPSVFVDNKRGMEELVAHLVQEHKYTRFAFIKGPVGNPEAEERQSLLKNYLNDHGLGIYATDMAPGDFNRESGKRGIQQFLESGSGDILYDVIVCADDETAYGAIEQLRLNGFEVPEDVAVVGFDDERESHYITPPLTTVKQPLKELGSKAMEILLRRISGEEVPMETILDASLKVRQSCGCFEHSVRKALIKKALIEAVSARQQLESGILYNYVAKKLSLSQEMFAFDYPQVHELVEAFTKDVNGMKSDLFLQTFDRLGRMKILHGSNLVKWNNLLSTLWYFSLSHLDRDTFSFADSLIHRARIIRGNLVLRAQGYRRIEAQREYSNTHEIGEQISNTIDLDKLLNLISEELPELGLDTFYVTFYKNPTEPLHGSTLVLSVENGVVGMKSTNSTMGFDTQKLLPTGVISSEYNHVIVSEPLYFHNELFGVIYFLADAQIKDVNLFEVLGTYISNALHSRYLLMKVEQQADILRVQNAELEELRKKEHAYLQAIKSELEFGRKIQLSFLPQEIYQPKGYGISFDFKPAREVSGDFYDVFALDEDTVAIIIADVSGKDVSAALFMSLVKTLIRVFSDRAYEEKKSPLSILGLVNDYVIKHHQQPRGRCMFATLLYGVLTPSTGEFKYVNAGHNPSLLLDVNGKVREELKPGAPAIGLAAGLDFPTSSCHIEKGEYLFNYTDGVTEAQNLDNEFYTLERVIELLGEINYNDSERPIAVLREELQRFTEGATPFDDITMIGLYRNR